MFREKGTKTALVVCFLSVRGQELRKNEAEYKDSLLLSLLSGTLVMLRNSASPILYTLKQFSHNFFYVKEKHILRCLLTPSEECNSELSMLSKNS